MSKKSRFKYVSNKNWLFSEMLTAKSNDTLISGLSFIDAVFRVKAFDMILLNTGKHKLVLGLDETKYSTLTRWPVSELTELTEVLYKQLEEAQKKGARTENQYTTITKGRIYSELTELRELENKHGLLTRAKPTIRKVLSACIATDVILTLALGINLYFTAVSYDYLKLLETNHTDYYELLENIASLEKIKTKKGHTTTNIKYSVTFDEIGEYSLEGWGKTYRSLDIELYTEKFSITSAPTTQDIFIPFGIYRLEVSGAIDGKLKNKQVMIKDYSSTNKSPLLHVGDVL